MKTLTFCVPGLLTFVVFGLIQSPSARAHSPDALLLPVYSAMRITGAHIAWIPNPQGTRSPYVVYDLTNTTNNSIPVPLTKVGSSPAHWSGTRQLWIERLGPDANIPAMPKQIVRRGRQYANGGSVIWWPTSLIGPRHFHRFADPIWIGGFPSGRYAATIEYLTTHGGKVIQSQVLYFDVP